MAVQGDVLLKMRDVCKSFPGVKALDGVNLTIRRGEIHALVGENGAGKSTLIKILSGIYAMDSGSMEIEGRPAAFANAAQAQRCGVSTIHQELNMIPDLSVRENIFLGREIRRFGGLAIDWRKTNERARELLKMVGIPDIDIYKPVRLYGTAIQQMVSIARALAVHAKLVIMDEPTSSLDADEVSVLFEVMRGLKARGISIIFISHRIEEIFRICERVTILKDGALAGAYSLREITQVEMVSKMIGRDASAVMQAKRADEARTFTDCVAQLKDAYSESKVRGVSLSIHKGQVVGLAGLLGSGRTEIGRLFFGLDKLKGGELIVKGARKILNSPRDAIRAGLAFLPEDRRMDGIVADMSVRENLTLALLPALTRRGIVDVKRQRRIVEEYVKRLNIKTPSLDQPIRLLSGGNQQKVVLARWMCTHLDLIVFDEPTRGIDVGAKEEIEKLIRELAREGIGILMISSELNEVIRNSDRVDVISDGRKVGELSGRDISQDAILAAIAAGAQRRTDE